ncbi:MAG TPA: DUF3147 family protein [Desulfuromonadaceae bacterium]
MFLVKLLLSNLIIVTCVLVGRRFPLLGGLIATMPLTSLIVLVWLATDTPGDSTLLAAYTRGVLWGILPTIAFFGAAYLCLRKGMGLPGALATGGVLWVGGALLHQWLLR